MNTRSRRSQSPEPETNPVMDTEPVQEKPTEVQDHSQDVDPALQQILEEATSKPLENLAVESNKDKITKEEAKAVISQLTETHGLPEAAA